MGLTKKRPRNRNRKQEAIPTVKKGRIVEQITAAFHQSPLVEVRRNVWLPVIGVGKARREIDVLVTGEVAGYSVRLAFECKNERSPIGVKRVDEFIGRLKDVGIPPQHGILVSASGYTEDAIGRGEREHIRLLTLAGLTREGLSSILYEAFQAVVFLMVDIARFAIEYKEETGASEHPYMFFNERGEFCGYLHHFVWDVWRKGLLPFSIGEHALDLGVPPNLYHMINKELQQIESISVNLKVTGFVISFPGKAEHLLLLDAKNKSLERAKLNVTFDKPNGQYPVDVIRTEKEFQTFVKRPEAIRVVTRVKLPRIRTDRGVYWPVSERILSIMFERVRAYQRGETPEPYFEDLGEFEGTDLTGAWEPVSEAYLIASQTWLGCTKVEQTGVNQEQDVEG